MLHIKPVESPGEMKQARAIRQQVFVEEQGVPPEEEWDGQDDRSRLVLGLVNGKAVATARWRTVPYEERLTAKLERFAVLPGSRGRGYGRQLVEAILKDARRAGFDTFLLHAQAHLQDYYASFGFRPAGKPFTEAGIPHVKMVRREA